MIVKNHTGWWYTTTTTATTVNEHRSNTSTMMATVNSTASTLSMLLLASIFLLLFSSNIVDGFSLQRHPRLTSSSPQTRRQYHRHHNHHAILLSSVLRRSGGINDIHHCTCPFRLTQKTSALNMELEDSSSSDPSPPTTTAESYSAIDRPVLALLDLVSLLVFAAIGRASHASDGSIDVLATCQTALPFVVAWFTSSFFTGVYGPVGDDDTSNVVVQSWKQTARGWIVAVPLGCVGRGLIKGYVPPVPFVVVTMIATLVILGTTRMLYNIVTVSSSSSSSSDNE